MLYSEYLKINQDNHCVSSSGDQDRLRVVFMDRRLNHNRLYRDVIQGWQEPFAAIK